MKFLKLTLLLAFVFVFFENSFAQGSYGTIESFTIDYAHLSGGQNILRLNIAPTPIKYKVYLSRSSDPAGGSWAFYPVDIIIGLGYLKDGKYLFFEGSFNFKSTNFGEHDSLIEKELTAQVDQSKLTPSDKIYLVFEYHKPGFPSSSWKTEKFPTNTAGYGFVLPATIYYNVAKSASFTRNNCPAGSESKANTYVVYSVPANRYSSSISQTDADAKAQTEINANGQNKANLEGLCIEFGDVKTPTTSFQFGYTSTEDIKWNPNSFIGQNVRIESYSYDSSLNDFVLTSIISGNAPNTGILKAGINHTSLGNIGNTLFDRKIKIVSIDSGIGIYSNIFQLGLD